MNKEIKHCEAWLAYCRARKMNPDTYEPIDEKIESDQINFSHSAMESRPASGIKEQRLV